MTDISADHRRPLRELPAFSSQPWQMSYGERAVIEGMLTMIKPRLAIEVGRAEGGSLRRIAEHSDEVVSFDVVDAPAELAALENVTAVTGDSHTLLARELARIADEGREVDFVLLDGDHSAEGVRRDMVDVLESPAFTSGVILAHDTLNDDVRIGLEEVDYDAYQKVAWVDLDFIPGYAASGPLSRTRLGEVWGGFGLVVADATGAFQAGGARRGDDRERHAAWVREIDRSVGWRVGAPLRGLERRLRRLGLRRPY